MQLLDYKRTVHGMEERVKPRFGREPKMSVQKINDEEISFQCEAISGQTFLPHPISQRNFVPIDRMSHDRDQAVAFSLWRRFWTNVPEEYATAANFGWNYSSYASTSLIIPLP
jgi:hypothetical protein